MRRCHKLGDAALAALAARGALRFLCVHSVPAVGAATMRALAAACHATLEVLDISFCRCFNP